MKAVINGRSFESAAPVSILEAARKLGISIPTLCDHPRVPPAAACRICLVEIVGRREPVPACATSLEEGMQVATDTPTLRTLRRSVLGLILSEHPSACLVCTEGKDCREPKEGIRKTAEPTGCVLCPQDGRCRLQDVVAEVGLEASAFPEAPRSAEPRRDDPLIDRDQGLCILCGLCVRVCRDVRGASVLTFVGRGGRTSVGTALDRTLLESGCRFCGACVDVCPTGALLERGIRHRRPGTWAPFVCALCGEGCLLEAGLESGRLVGTRPGEGRANRGQACVKGRFILPEILNHPDRLIVPLVRKGGHLEPASWDEALAAAATGLKSLAGSVEMIASAQDCCEDLWALRRLTRDVFGSDRFLWAGPAAPRDVLLEAIARKSGAGLPDVVNDRLAELKAIFVLDENPEADAPILGLALHRAVRSGARLAVLAPGESGLERWAKVRVRAGYGEAADFLLDVLAALSTAGAAERSHLRKDRQASDEKAARVAALLEKRRPAAIVFGPRILSGAHGRRNAAAIWSLAAATGATLVPLLWEANARAARALLGTARPSGEAGQARGRIVAADVSVPDRLEGGFVVALSAFKGHAAAEADVVLPRALFPEQDGTWVNREGRIQRSRAAVAPPEEARSLRAIAASLAAAAGRTDAAAGSDEDILAEIECSVPAFCGARRAWPSEPAVFLGGEARPPQRMVPIPPAAEAGEDDGFSGHPDDVHGWPAAAAIKSLKAVRRR